MEMKVENKPWFHSPELFQSKNPLPSQTNKSYQVIHAKDEDVKKVVEWYLKCPVPGFAIKSVEIIENPQMNRLFAGKVELLNLRHEESIFNPTWEERSKSPEEKKERHFSYNLFRQMAEPFHDNKHPYVSLVPLWHGTDSSSLDSIFKLGYANLGKTDSGYLGRGIYGTGEAEYAFRVYCKGALIINWYVVYSVFPMIRNDKLRFQGLPNHENYDGHFAPVGSADQNNPNEVVYFPCAVNERKYTELAVFESTHVLPKYLITIEREFSIEFNVSFNSASQPNELLQQPIERQQTNAHVSEDLKKVPEMMAFDPIPIKIDRDSFSQSGIVMHNANQDSIGILVERINRNPNDIGSLLKIAELMVSLNKTVPSASGRPVTPKHICLKVLRSNPQNIKAYQILCKTLGEKESIDLPDGRKLDKEQLVDEFLKLNYLKKIQLNPKDARNYIELARALKKEEMVCLHDGRKLNRRGLLVETLKLDPKNANNYNELACALNEEEMICLHDGRKLNKRDLLIEALKVDPKFDVAYHNLACTFLFFESITLPDGRKMNKTQLLQEVEHLRNQEFYEKKKREKQPPVNLIDL